MSNLKSLDKNNICNDINFTKDQKNAIDKIVDFIAKPFNSANHNSTSKRFFINFKLFT